MWRKEVLDMDDPEHISVAMRAFAITDRAVRGDDAVMAAAGDPLLAPTIACWSLVHGYVSIIIDGAFFDDSADAVGTFDVMLDAALQYLDLGQEPL
jgi:hypothetical protein